MHGLYLLHNRLASCLLLIIFATRQSPLNITAQWLWKHTRLQKKERHWLQYTFTSHVFLIPSIANMMACFCNLCGNFECCLNFWIYSLFCSWIWMYQTQNNFQKKLSHCYRYLTELNKVKHAACGLQEHNKFIFRHKPCVHCILARLKSALLVQQLIAYQQWFSPRSK